MKDLIEVTIRATKNVLKVYIGSGGPMFNNLQLTKAQAGALAVELMLFAEGREVEEENV